ncbi:MFS general substrate transporter [Schizopora paradoxa]|uniref:MFS general substrate transporter n=1 Tax=Schizopora paradoxa TaxID=27342 RepID=A0A0H2S2I7_9AGAM|nr:MFS general substrate transporter [Schizopora paradoxa]
MSEISVNTQIDVDEKLRISSSEKASLNEVEAVPAVPAHLPTIHSATELALNVGLQEFLECKESGLELTPEANKRILRKIDLYILSLMFITSILQFLDKTALNYANLFGIRNDLDLTGSQLNWLASIFYFGYMSGQFPASYLYARFSTGKIIGVCTVLWGITVLAFSFTRNFAAAAVLRYFLGIFEAPITPGLTLAVGYWWTRSEAPLRMNVIYSALGWAGVIGSLMSAGISGDTDSGPIKRWQLVFVVLGSITTAWGFVIYFFLADSPVEAQFLSREDRLLATRRVAQNQVGIKNGQFKLYQVKHALIDIKMWLTIVTIFAAGIPNGVISNFSTELINNLGFSTTNTALLDCVGNLFQVVGLIVGGYVASYIPNTRSLVCTAGNIACLIGAACLAYLPANKTWLRLVAFWWNNVQSVSFSLALNMISVNMSGYTKKQIASALTFIAYCVGNIVGPQFVIQTQTPTFPTATKAMMVGFVVKLVCQAALGFYMLRVNTARDNEMKQHDELDKESERQRAETAGMLDQTEFENKAMRYVL